MADKGSKGKFLPQRRRIFGRAAVSGGLAAQNAGPGFFPVVRGALQSVNRRQAKIPTAA